MPLPWAWWRLGGLGPKTVRDVPVADVVGAGFSMGRPVRALEISDVVGGSVGVEALHRVVRHLEVSDVLGAGLELDFVRRTVRRIVVEEVAGAGADVDHVRRRTRHIEVSDTSGVAGELDFVRRAVRDFPFLDVLGAGAAQRQVRRAVRDLVLQDVGNVAGAFVPRHRRGRVLRSVEVADVLGAGVSRTTRPVGPPTVTYDPEYLARRGTVTATLSYTGGIGRYEWQYGLRGRWFNFTTGTFTSLTYTLPSWVPNGWAIRISWVRNGRREYGPELIVGAKPPVDLSGSVDLTAMDAIATRDLDPAKAPVVTILGETTVEPGGSIVLRAVLTGGLYDEADYAWSLEDPEDGTLTPSADGTSAVFTAADEVTTDTDQIYILASSAPSAPAGGTSDVNHLPAGWSRSQPSPTIGQDVYRASRTRTYTNGAFTSATGWGSVTKVADRLPDEVTTDTDRIYRRASSTPSAPAGGTSQENHLPTGWSRAQPSATTTQNVYRASRTRTYTNGVFTSATGWGSVTKVADRTAPAVPSVPTGVTVDVYYPPLFPANTYSYRASCSPSLGATQYQWRRRIRIRSVGIWSQWRDRGTTSGPAYDNGISGEGFGPTFDRIELQVRAGNASGWSAWSASATDTIP